MRTRSAAAFVVVTILVSAPAARAHLQPQASQFQPQAPAAPSPAASADDQFKAIGVSLDRIRHMLRETPPAKITATSSLLKLEYHIEVVGKAPPITIFKDFNIGRTTATQYGGMTHAEFLRITAPPWRPW